MSLNKQTSLAAMRTYAKDVAKHKGDTLDTDKPTSPKKEAVVSRKAAPVSSGKHKIKPVPPQKKPHHPATSKKTAPKKTTPEPTPAKVSATLADQLRAFNESEKNKNPDTKTPITHVAPKKESLSAATKKLTATSKKTGTKKAPKKVQGSATIITNNKTSRESFFSRLGKSLQQWFKDFRENTKPKRRTYTVRKTTRRKGVVQKATSKTGAIFTADNETLQKQIRARQRAAEQADHDDLNWSPYTEPGYPLLEGEELESTDERVLSVITTPKTTHRPKAVIATSEKIAELQPDKEPILADIAPEPEPTTVKSDELVEESSEKAEAATQVLPQTKTPVVSVITEPVPAPAPAPTPATRTEELPVVTDEEPAVANKDVAETPLPEAQTEPVPAPAPTNEVPAVSRLALIRESLKDTNTIAMLVLGFILAVAVVYVVFLNLAPADNQPQPVQTENNVSTFLPNATTENILITTGSYNDLLVNINLAVREPTENITEFQFTNSLDQVVSGQIMMNLIQTKNNTSLASRVTEVRLVETSENHRAFILQTEGSNAARGGMFDWEEELYADIGALLNIHNQAPKNAGEFVDITIGSADTRALQFDGVTLVLYTITDDGVIIITAESSIIETYLNQ